jgi:hypothetical protein
VDLNNSETTNSDPIAQSKKKDHEASNLGLMHGARNGLADC